MASQFQRFHCFLADAMSGKHNLGSDVLKWMLVTGAPDLAAHAGKADLTEISAGSGYSAGGSVWGGVTATQTGGVFYLKGNDVSWAASGGAIGTFRAAVLYNDTAAGKPLIGTITFPVHLGVPDGSAFNLDLNPTTGIYYST